MDRRKVLGSSLAAAAAISSPRIASAQSSKVLKFIPLGDVAILDPHRVSLKVTAHHAFMVFDTLYGIDSSFKVHPQMAEGHVVSQDGLTWDIKLRPGLKFHDGERVLAKDCVASIKRWAGVDGSGVVLIKNTDELSATSDDVIRFRLKRPFSLLPLVLGKMQGPILAIMPERLANTPATTILNEMVGSGPFKYVAAERVPGARHVYEKNRDYVPRSSGVPDQISGPKVVHLDRVEWHVIPDPSTAAAALQSGEMDWWERPTSDLLPLLKRDKRLQVFDNDKLGEVGALVLNKSVPPFNNPAICRAMFNVIDQADIMQAVAGTDPANWRSGIGTFAPGSPWYNQAGLENVNAPIDLKKAKRELVAAGYAGEKVAVLVAADIPDILAASQVSAEAFKKAGLNVDFQSMDLGSMVTRRLSRKPVSEGGWSCYFIPLPGISICEPLLTQQFRGAGESPSNGFTKSEKLEEILTRWAEAQDDAARMALAEELQRQARIDTPFIATGNYFVPTVFRTVVQNVPPGTVHKFWSVTKS